MDPSLGSSGPPRSRGGRLGWCYWVYLQIERYAAGTRLLLPTQSRFLAQRNTTGDPPRCTAPAWITPKLFSTAASLR